MVGNMTNEADQFYEWFNHGVDIDDQGPLCQSEMTLHGPQEQHVKVVLEDVLEKKEGAETIIIDDGSDVSLFLRRF